MAPKYGRIPAWGWELAALGVALLGVVVRCISWSRIFSDGEVVLIGVDPYYHILRAKMLVDSLPAIAGFDPLLSFPAGAPVPWPPGFDLLLTLPGVLGGGKMAIAGWGAVLMPVLGGLAVYLTYRMGRMIFDPAIGLAAAAFMALMPGGIKFSLLGRVDHHALVAPVILGMFVAMLKSHESPSRTRSYLWGVGCGLLAAFSVGSWVITPPLYFLPIPMTLLALRLGGESDKARRAAWSCLVSAAVLVFLVVVSTADLGAKPFSLYRPSWFVVALFSLVPVFVLPFFYRRLALAGIAAVGVLLAGFAVFLPEFFLPLQQALEVASGADPSYLMAKESSHIFLEGGAFSLRGAIADYTYLVLLVPFVWVVWLYRAAKARNFSASNVLGLSFAMLAIMLLLLQRRFGEFSAPAMSFLFGWMIVAGARFFLVFFRSASSKLRAWIWAVLLTVAVGAAVSPIPIRLLKSSGGDPVEYQRELLAFGRKIKRSLPSPETPGTRPAYGLISGWNDANLLRYSTGLPVMVNSFATPEARKGNKKAFRLLLSADEQAAYRGMVENQIRFVVTTNLIPSVDNMARIAGLPERFVVSITTDTGSVYRHDFQPLRPLAESVYMRMFLCDGSGINRLGYPHKPLSHYRLLLESSFKTFMGKTILPMFKLFEVVAGARLAGEAEPGERVRLKLPLVTNTGRQFLYRSDATTGPDGRFEFVVPYPTETGDSAVVPLGSYLIKVGEEIFEASVTENDVDTGQAVTIRSRGP